MSVTALLDDFDAVIQLYAEGWKSDEIAERYGVSYRTVLNHLHKRGVQTRKPGHGLHGHNKRLLTPEQETEAVALYEDGLTNREVAERFGVSVPTMKRLIRTRSTPRRAGRYRRVERRVDDHGYVRVRIPDDDALAPMRDTKGWIPEHRLVMARSLARALARTESVHHINGDRADNRLENLQLRQGKHGHGQCYECADCGSRNIVTVKVG
jgi:transposase